MKKTKLGQELIGSLEESLKFERGNKKLRMSTLEIPKQARHWKKNEIAELRKKRLGMSQPIFASLLSVTPSTIRAWEQGLKTPSGAASRLLEVVAVDPQVFIRIAQQKSLSFSKPFVTFLRRQ